MYIICPFRPFQGHRWHKRGLGIVPMKFCINWITMNYTVMVSVFNGDGTVAVSHAGIEVGQGINTKVHARAFRTQFCLFVVVCNELCLFNLLKIICAPYKFGSLFVSCCLSPHHCSDVTRHHGVSNHRQPIVCSAAFSCKLQRKTPKLHITGAL